MSDKVTQIRQVSRNSDDRISKCNLALSKFSIKEIKETCLEVSSKSDDEETEFVVVEHELKMPLSPSLGVLPNFLRLTGIGELIFVKGVRRTSFVGGVAVALEEKFMVRRGVENVTC